MWRVIKRVVRNTSAPKHAMSLFKNLDSSLVRLKFFSCETGSNFIILYMFCQEATDFCITIESKSTSPAPKFSHKSNCFTAAGAMSGASTSSEFRDVQSIRRNQFPVTGFRFGVTVSNSQVVLVCPSIAAHRLERTTDMFGPRYRTLDLSG